MYTNATINPKYQYAISNEVAGKIPARVSVEEGALLLIKDRFGQFKFLFEFADKKTTPPFITLPSHDIMEKFKHS